MRDFTLGKYRSLIGTIQGSGYTTSTVCSFLRGQSTQQCVVLRHDVDRRPGNALKMAELEHTLGVVSTYYFRYPATFNPTLITHIRDLGHEVGYHYEVLAKTKGRYKEALALFRDELSAFREICDVRTICMHGSPFSRYDNRDLWKEYNFRDYGIEGEAYLSMTGKGLRYLTDTGRSWSGRRSIRDVMPGAAVAHVETTDDLAQWVRSAREERLYLTMHPERWAADEGEWAIGYMTDLVANTGKAVLTTMRWGSGLYSRPNTIWKQRLEERSDPHLYQNPEQRSLK